LAVNLFILSSVPSATLGSRVIRSYDNLDFVCGLTILNLVFSFFSQSPVVELADLILIKALQEGYPGFSY
jgi:hypothetical protein